MDKWDEEKLKEVVEKKHGASGNKPGTDIVSSSKEHFFFFKGRALLHLQAFSLNKYTSINIIRNIAYVNII